MTRPVIGSFAIVLVGWLACPSAQSAADGNVADDSTAAIVRDEAPSVRAAWSMSAVHGFSRFSSDRPAWRTDAVVVRRHVPRRSTYSVELGLVGRHGEDDPFMALDMYRNFGSRTYGNLRLAVSPGARVIPRSDIFLEAFHAPGNGWEFSAGYRRADYVNSGANTWLVGAGKYIGNWYLRARQSATQVDGSMGYAILGTVRRYFGTSDGFVGFTVAKGREIVAFPGTTNVEARNSLSGSIFYQRSIGRGAGIRVGLEGVDDGDLSRWGVTTGVLWNW